MSLELSFSNSTRHYSEQELRLLKQVPKHIAVIMDGNRRWARRGSNITKVMSALDGHWQGAHTLSSVVEAASELGVSYLTMFAFSTENWKRSPHEVKTLMQILIEYLKRKRPSLIHEGVKFGVIGDISAFGSEVCDEIAKTVDATRGGQTMTLTLALNYGGRDEITRAAKALANDYKSGNIDTISEKMFSRYLDTGHLPDPDLLIRTSGEMRISNFLLWQIAYAEVYITETLWPDFTPVELFKAVLEYQNRDRRGGE